MSEIRVDTISEKTSGSGTTVSSLVNPNSPFRNLIINGDMKIAQRATGATTITNNSVHYATVDRFAVYESSDAVLLVNGVFLHNLLKHKIVSMLCMEHLQQKI